MIQVIYQIDGIEFEDYDVVYNYALFVSKMGHHIVSFDKMMLRYGIKIYMATHYVTPNNEYIDSP